MSSPAASHRGGDGRKVFLKPVGSSSEIQQVLEVCPRFEGCDEGVIDLLDPLTSVTFWTFDS